jgi:hypothetical protein
MLTTICGSFYTSVFLRLPFRTLPSPTFISLPPKPFAVYLVLSILSRILVIALALSFSRKARDKTLMKFLKA